MNFDTSIIKNGWKNGEVMGIVRIQYGQHLAAILNI